MEQKKKPNLGKKLTEVCGFKNNQSTARMLHLFPRTFTALDRGEAGKTLQRLTQLAIAFIEVTEEDKKTQILQDLHFQFFKK